MTMDVPRLESLVVEGLSKSRTGLKQQDGAEAGARAGAGSSSEQPAVMRLESAAAPSSLWHLDPLSLWVQSSIHSTEPGSRQPLVVRGWS